MREPEPLLWLHQLITAARPPQRADRAAAGTLPTRAYRYCDAATSAAGYGWWIFPAIELQLLWDGHDIFWYFDGAEDWMPLAPAAQFPDFAAAFDEAVPPGLEGCAPPFLTALPEPGLLQVWTGIMARTAPGWSLLIRPPVNLPSPGGYSLYEGIVETDRWFGPLFTNLRLTHTNRPIKLRAEFPLLQVQLLPRIAYAEETGAAANVITGMEQMTAADWSAYRDTIVIPNEDPERGFGAYAVAARKRRRGGCPFTAEQAARIAGLEAEGKS